MWNFIHKLQKKPERERRRILIGSTFGITLIIFAFWISSLSLKGESQAEKERLAESPIKSLSASISSAFSDISFEEPTSTISTEFATDTPQYSTSTASSSPQ